MCIDFDGHHSGGSSFVYVNDFWLLQKLLYTHRYKFSSEKKKKKKEVKSPSIWFRTPKPVRIRQSGRTGNRGKTVHLIDEGYVWVPKIRDFTEDPSEKFGKSKVSGLGSVHEAS